MKASSPAACPGEPVPQTVTPWRAAAARSIAALRRPVVTSSFSLGRRSNRLAGKGVRSRMMQTISKSWSAFATASSAPRWRSNTVISTRSRSGDQSAMVSATRW